MIAALFSCKKLPPKPTAILTDAHSFLFSRFEHAACPGPSCSAAKGFLAASASH